MEEHTDAYELAEYALLNLAGEAITTKERTTLEALLQRAFAVADGKKTSEEIPNKKGRRRHVS